MIKKQTIKLIREAAMAIKQAIDNNPLSRKNIYELARDVFVGRNQLQSAFKQISEGKTVRRYRLEKRMEIAKDMLETENWTMKIVSLKCGYKKQNNFTADFRNVLGVTPSQCIETSNNEI